MPLNLNNATYKSFTDFASNVNGRTIAAFGDDTTSVQGGGSLGGRTIVPSHNRDFIGNVRRNTSKQEANNAVRKLFRQSIIDMFGGESMIPESVKTAMKLEDYGKGKPLSARRIMAVKVAIDAVKAEMQPVKIDEAKARQMVDQSENMLGFALGDPEDASKASQLLMKYGDGLPGKSAQVLSNFIVNSMIRAGDPSVEFDEDILRDFADDLKTWDEFSLGDNRLNEVGKEFMKLQNDYIRQNFNVPKQFSSANPDVFKAMEDDANRSTWSINGKQLPLGSSKETVVSEFCSAVKESKSRKAISTIFHQGTQSDLQKLFYKTVDPQAETNLCQLPGGNLFVSRDLVKHGNGITRTNDCQYDLRLSEDGKTATMTVTSMQDLTIFGAPADQYKIGKAIVTLQSTIDLTKDIPEVTDVKFAQTFTPNEIYKSA